MIVETLGIIAVCVTLTWGAHSMGFRQGAAQRTKDAMGVPTGNRSSIAIGLRTLMHAANDHARRAGFRDKDKSFGDEVALILTEAAEAFEAHRHGNPQSEHIPDFSGVEEEFADIIIRVAETAEHHNFDLPAAVLAKMKYNTTRPRMHGGKLL